MRRRVTIWTSPDIIDTRITRTPKIKRIPNPHPFSDGVLESFFVFILLSLLTLPAIWGVTGVWLAIPVAEFVTLFLSIFYQRRKRTVYHYA